MEEAGDQDGPMGGWVILIAVTVVTLVIGGFFYLKLSVNHSLHRADCVTLTETVRRWKEAGSPTGEKLAEFMQGRRSDIIATNRLFAIRGTNYTTLLAVTKPSSGRTGTLFVTANGILIWLDGSGTPRIAEFGGTPTKSPPVIPE